MGVSMGVLGVPGLFEGGFGAELVSNSGFEVAGAGGADVFGSWIEIASDGTIADEGSIVAHGSHAAKLTAGPSLDTRLLAQCAVAAGKTYRLTFFTRGEGTNPTYYSVYDITNATYIIPPASTGISTVSYSVFQTDFVVPAGCNQVYVGIWCPVANGAVSYFDDVSLRQRL